MSGEVSNSLVSYNSKYQLLSSQGESNSSPSKPLLPPAECLWSESKAGVSVHDCMGAELCLNLNGFSLGTSRSGCSLIQGEAGSELGAMMACGSSSGTGGVGDGFDVRRD